MHEANTALLDILVNNTINRHPHRENVENILAICLPIVTMKHIRESPSASHAMRMNQWNALLLYHLIYEGE